MQRKSTRLHSTSAPDGARTEMGELIRVSRLNHPDNPLISEWEVFGNRFRQALSESEFFPASHEAEALLKGLAWQLWLDGKLFRELL